MNRFERLVLQPLGAGSHLRRVSGRLPGSFRRAAPAALRLQPFRVPGRRLAAWPPGPRRQPAQRERLGSGRGSAPQGWPHPQGAIPHRRPHRSFLSPARPVADRRQGRHRLAFLDPLRLFSTAPGRADGALRGHLAPGVQRRALHRHMGRVQSGVALPAARAICNAAATASAA